MCAPVKDAIRRKYEQSRQVINMATENNKRGYHIGNGSRNNAYKRLRGNDGTLVVPMQRESVQKYPLDPVSCPMYCFTADQVDSHFKTIHEGMPKLNASKIRDICLPILDVGVQL